MPVILAEIDWLKWLGEEPASEHELLALLKPCPDAASKIWPVDKMVGNVNDSASMNVWLHKQVMIKLVENGGKVPNELRS